MISILYTALYASVLTTPFDDAAATELRYSGSLTQVGRNANGVPVKKFSLYCLVTDADADGHSVAFLVDERGGGGWSWPERYGQLDLDANHQPASESRIKLLHSHNETLYPLSLRQPLFEFAGKLKEGASWNAGESAYEVSRMNKVAGKSCWQVDVRSNIGRRQKLWIEKNSPLIVASEQRVFMGQGDEFALKMELESAKPIDQKQLAKLQTPLHSLLRLKKNLLRKADESNPQLSEIQLAVARQVIERLEKEANATPFSQLASIINRDVKSQSQRTNDLASLAKKSVGQPAPEFVLKTIDRQTVDSKKMAGKIVVLHFWSYKSDPLVEPYGQTAYLDFLSNRRRKMGVSIYGVAVNSLLADPSKVSSGVRSARKLREFMNLSYPITTDDGALLKKFGDPRLLGGKLPLWVVIGPDGKIEHYKVGFYAINPDEGLRQLDAVVVELIKKQRGQ